MRAVLLDVTHPLASMLPTEFLEMHAPEPKLLVMVIPGNPGVIPFYSEYIQQLYHNMGGRASVVGVSHAGHTHAEAEADPAVDREPRSISNDREDEQGTDKGHANGGQPSLRLSLRDQIKHKMDALEHCLEVHPGADRDPAVKSLPVVLVGHSIGAYMALECLRRASDRVAAVVGLFPFLWTNPASNKQAAIRRLVSSPLALFGVGSLAWCLARLPQFASDYFVRRWFASGMDPFAQETVGRYMLQRETVLRCGHLAKTEFEDLSKPLDWELLSAHGEKLVMLFGCDDHWGPSDHMQTLAEKVQEMALHVADESCEHAFCVSAQQSTLVAQKTVAYLQKILAN
eukprot:jgi/Mesvir1/4007/Mv03701-RA.1